jgi:formate dehydrogenase maturation protein FdhE
VIEQERLDIIRHAVAAVGEAVDYDRENGVVCPACGVQHPPKGAGVTRTMAWSRGMRERYHRCPLCHCSFRSVESN